MKNTGYRIVAVPTDFASSVRADPRAVRRLDGQPHQCRHCLTLSSPGEAVLLASFSPFRTDQPYAERGPVFVHERNCPRYADDSAYPRQFPRRAAVLRAYDGGEALVDARVVGDSDVDALIAELFADTRVAFLHARNVAEGCFMFRIERAAGV